MSETKALFAERTKRSLKNILYRYMEEYGSKYIHETRQLFTILSSRKNGSTVLIPKNVKNSDFLYLLYSHYESIRNPSLRLETEFASQSVT